MSSSLRTRGAVALAGLMLAGSALAAPSQPVQGEVRKLDIPNSRITLKHGPIPELELPAMTLVYLVADPNQLQSVQPGDNIRFTAERRDGQYVVITITR